MVIPAEWMPRYEMGVFVLFGLITLWQWRAENHFLDYLRSHHEDAWRRVVPHSPDRRRRNKRWRIQLRLSRFCWSRARVKSLGDPEVTRLSRQRMAFELAGIALIAALVAPWWLN